MDKKSLLKKVGIPVAIVLFVGVLGYLLYVNDVFLIPTLAPIDPELSQTEREIISLLNDLKGIELSGEIFNSPMFNGLTDFGVVLTPEPIGRDNPFAPLTN